MNLNEHQEDLHPDYKVTSFSSSWLEENQSGCFYFIDATMVVTGVIKLVASGYLVEYWVTGLSWSDFHDDFEKTPRLLLKVTLGIRKKANNKELEDTIMQIWNFQLAELAHLAAIEGQMLRLENSVPENEESSFHAKWQLMGHHRIGTFDEGTHKNPATVRAARQYELLKSMGYTRPQKAIVEFETRVLQTKLMMTALEGRLNTARTKGLVRLKEESEQAANFFTGRCDWLDLE